MMDRFPTGGVGFGSETTELPPPQPTRTAARPAAARALGNLDLDIEVEKGRLEAVIKRGS